LLTRALTAATPHYVIGSETLADTSVEPFLLTSVSVSTLSSKSPVVEIISSESDHFLPEKRRNHDVASNKPIYSDDSNEIQKPAITSTSLFETAATSHSHESAACTTDNSQSPEETVGAISEISSQSNTSANQFHLISSSLSSPSCGPPFASSLSEPPVGEIHSPHSFENSGQRIYLQVYEYSVYLFVLFFLLVFFVEFHYK
jgi:hypothetical protein